MQDLSWEYKCYNYFMVITLGNFLCFNDEYIVHLRCTIPWFIQYHVGMEMRLCFYVQQHICYSAYMLLPVRPSVRPSHGYHLVRLHHWRFLHYRSQEV